MSLETVPLSQLKPNADNPRTSFDLQRIEALAETILQQGVLQNLVVKRTKGRKAAYTVVAGGRRLRALQLLHERGELPERLSRTGTDPVGSVRHRYPADGHN